MKRITIFFVSVVTLLCLAFISCEKSKEKGDVLKGTWKWAPFNSTDSGTEIYDMTYVFDGKGNYTFTSNTSDGLNNSNGTYTIKDEIYVILYYKKYTIEGEYVGEGSQLMELDLESNPQTLTADVYDNYGNHLITMIFEKQ